MRVVGREKLQLLGVAAMLVAAKYEEIFPPTIEDFVYISDNTYARADVLDMESQLLRALNFAVTVVTPFQFLGYLCDAAIPLPPSSSSSSSSSSGRTTSSSHSGSAAAGESAMSDAANSTPTPTQQQLLPALQLRSLARYIAELNTIEPVYFRYAPSHFAAACVLVALHALCQRTTHGSEGNGNYGEGCWSPALQQLRYTHTHRHTLSRWAEKCTQ